MNRQRNGFGRVLWLPVAAAVVLVGVWFIGAGRQNTARADEPQRLYISPSAGLSLNGVQFADEDILVLDTASGQWSLFFDGSELGLAASDIDALEILDDGSLLLSLDQMTTTLPGLAEVSDADILKFTPRTRGNYGSGDFSMYVDGSDIGLTTNAEDIDAIALNANGDLLISTVGTAKVPAANGGTITAKDADLLRLQLTQSGDNTAGKWFVYFDGSDVKLSTRTEDVSAAWFDKSTGTLFLSTLNTFSVNGLKGKGSDIFACQSFSSGNNTSCTFGPGLFWQGANFGFGSKQVDALAITGDVSVPPPPPPTSTPPPGATATPPPAATATPNPGSGHEMLIYDWNKPVNVSEKGMPRDNPPMASANGNWETPINYAQGTLYFHVEFYSMPVTKEMIVQFCVWQDAFAREECAVRSDKFVGRAGTVMEWSEPISTMWQKPGSVPIDWTRGRQIWGYVIRTASGTPVHPKFNWGGQNTAEWFPIKWRAMAVVVEKGKPFGGWAPYLR